jgi:Family of unknown function (DUF5329)
MKVIVLSAFATVALAFALPAAMSPDTEIDALLKYVGELQSALFIRNGSSHTAKEAESHLRLKWSSGGSRIATAEDFIRYCATKSSLSGKEYLIRFPDGHEEPSAQVLLKELQRIRARSPVAK